jgi:outer membrane protein assembly factor BamA
LKVNRLIKIRFILFVLLSLIAENRCFAQTSLNVIGADAESFLKNALLKSTYPDVLRANQALQEGLQTAYKKGYLAASIDSVWEEKNNYYAKVYLGKQYKWAAIRTTNIPSNLLRLSGFDSKDLLNQPIKPSLLGNVMEKMVGYYENNGYPFVTAQLDSVNIQKSSVSAKLKIKKGPLIKIDTIILNDEAGIKKSFIKRYLDIEEGELYSEKKIRKISQLIAELPFLEEAFPWKIYFGASETRLNLYLKNKSANRADVLIGLLPNNAEIGNKFLLTGDIKFAFVNALERGEKIDVNWQNLQFQSPRLTASASYPYLLNTQIGLSGTFDYYKKDTTFRTVSGELGFIYQFNAQDQIKAFYQTGSTRLITVNTSELLSNRALPANADIQTRSFGLEGSIRRVDYRFNPRKGWQARIKGAASIRDFIKNATIEDTFDPTTGENFSYLYDSINLRSYRFQLETDLGYFFPIGKRMTIAARYRGAIMFSEQNLYRNEIFQIGGFRILRGFDEESLFVNQYHIGTLEPRYLLSQNSYFFLFSDVGIIQRDYPGLNRQDNPFSVGLGMVFETKAGLFNISYAAGTIGNTGIQFRNSKIHFGYVNFF